MTAFAHIGQTDILRRCIDIYVGREIHGGRQIYRSDTGITIWDNEQPGEIIAPSLSIPEDVARALLDSLVRYFNGAEDTRALRKDYDAERARVDLMIGKLSNPVFVRPTE